MLTIRAEQMEALGSVQLERILIEHVHLFFYQQTDALGEEGTRTIVRQARERAVTKGFTNNTDVWRYVDLVFAFGLDFERTQPWAGVALEQTTKSTPSGRMDRLCEAAMEYLNGLTQAQPSSRVS